MLLDTHAYLWWLLDDPRLGPGIRAAMSDRQNETFVSIVSLWEATIKSRLGKLAINSRSIIEAVEPSGFTLLNLQAKHLTTLDALARNREHNDPFDHLLIAQAQSEDATIVSDDHAFGRYDIRILGCGT